MLKFKFNVTSRGNSHDWSTYRLIILPCLMMLILASEQSHAQSTSNLSSSIPDNSTLKWLVPAVVALFVFTVSQIIIPMINRYNDKRSARKTYLMYLQSSVENSKSHFGEEMSYDFYVKYHASGTEPDWLMALKKHGGIPTVFAAIETGIRKYESQAFNFEADDCDPYIPHLSFTGMPVMPLTEEHTLWKLDKDIVPIVSEYLLSQHQVKTTITTLNSEQHLSMAKSKNPERREQWIKSYRFAALDMAEHYKNILRLCEVL